MRYYHSIYHGCNKYSVNKIQWDKLEVVISACIHSGMEFAVLDICFDSSK